MRLANKVAIVTGAASGFGAGIASVFAREGAKVAVLDINGDGADGRRPRDRASRNLHHRRCHKTRRHRSRRAQNLGCFRPHRHRGEQRRMEPQEPAHARSERRGVRPRLRRECEVDLSHGACRGAAAGGAGRRRDHQHRLYGGDTSKARPDLVQRLEGRGEPDVPLDGRGTRAAKNPRELRGSCDGRDGPSWSSLWGCRIRRRTGPSSSQACRSGGSRSRGILRTPASTLHPTRQSS